MKDKENKIITFEMSNVLSVLPVKEWGRLAALVSNIELITFFVYKQASNLGIADFAHHQILYNGISSQDLLCMIVKIIIL